MPLPGERTPGLEGERKDLQRWDRRRGSALGGALWWLVSDWNALLARHRAARLEPVQPRTSGSVAQPCWAAAAQAQRRGNPSVTPSCWTQPQTLD